MQIARLLPLLATALSVGVSGVSTSAQAETNQVTDNLYACVGYYSLFSKVPDVGGIRALADQKRVLANKLIMKIEGKSFARPNSVSKNVETAFMNKVASPDDFAVETIEVDKSCMATIDRYTAALSIGTDLASIEPNAALAIYNDLRSAHRQEQETRRSNISDETRTLIKDLATCSGYFQAAGGADYYDKMFVAQMMMSLQPTLDRYAKFYDLETEVANTSIEAMMHYARLEDSNPIGFAQRTQAVGDKCGEVIGTARRNVKADTQ